MSNALLIFAKNPIIGKTKTRLAKTLGDDVALAIYYRLIKRAQELTCKLAFDKIVYYSDFIDTEDSWENSQYKKRKQANSDLGTRMDLAIQESLNEGYEKVVLMGTDIYALDGEIIKEAFSALDDHDVVIGPAQDGGYYLIGMKKASPSIFKLTAWSTNTVLRESINLVDQSQLSLKLLQELNDIDESEDLVGTDLERFIVK